MTADRHYDTLLESCMACKWSEPMLKVRCMHPNKRYDFAFTEREGGNCRGKWFETEHKPEAK